MHASTKRHMTISGTKPLIECLSKDKNYLQTNLSIRRCNVKTGLSHMAGRDSKSDCGCMKVDDTILLLFEI
jgi:hypothetical protein